MTADNFFNAAAAVVFGIGLGVLIIILVTLASAAIDPAAAQAAVPVQEGLGGGYCVRFPVTTTP